MAKSFYFRCRLIVFLALLCVSPIILAQKTVENVTASRDNADAVTVTWNPVTDAVSYEVTVEAWDVAINKSVRTVTTTETSIEDKDLPQPGLGRYTVTAVYADGTKSSPSEAAVGYSTLDTMRILGVSTRWPWKGTVDIDIEYKTVRPRFRELFGLADMPYPENVTVSVETADGMPVPVKSLEKEPAVDRNYTINRKIVANGTAILSGSGWLRLVWNADMDAPDIDASGAILKIVASDNFFQTKDSVSFHFNTTNTAAIELGDDDSKILLPWAARWADESSRSLNMQDGTDLVITEVSEAATKTVEVANMIQLADEQGVVEWQPGTYGVLDVNAMFTNRDTKAEATYKCTFLRSPTVPVAVEPVPEQKAFDIKWKAAGNCTYYQIMRRIVNLDGTCGEWENMAPVSTYSNGDGFYKDISVSCGITYEYTACPMYLVNNGSLDYLTSSPKVWTSGRLDAGITLGEPVTDKESIVLSWTDVPDAFSYKVLRNEDGGQFETYGSVLASSGSKFTDTDVAPGIRYGYKIAALNMDGKTLETSNTAETYTQLDVLDFCRLSPRFPWNGLVDVTVSYKSARNAENDGTPHFKITATSGNTRLDVNTLMCADGTPLDPGDFMLSGNGIKQRLLWNARTDLGESVYPDGISVTLSCVRVEPDQNTSSATAFAEGAVSGNIEYLDTRSFPVVELGSPTRIYADLQWFENATLLEVFVNDKSVFSTADENITSFTIGKEQLDVWGTNSIRLKTDNGMEWTASVKYPVFFFTATQGSKESILLKWNSLDNINEYSVRRRMANSGDAFEEVFLADNVTQWKDTSAETTVGEFEYIVMPLINGDDAGPALSPVIGYRAQDILRPVLILPIDNGSVLADKSEARYGEQVLLTVCPDSGYDLDELNVTGGGTDLDVVQTDVDKYTFSMPADNVVVSAKFKNIATALKTVKYNDGIKGKVLHDGQIFIIRNDKAYTMTGIEKK